MGSWAKPFDFTKLKIEESSNDWTNIHLNFSPQLVNQEGSQGSSPELIQQWQSLNFTYEQTQDWINTVSNSQQSQAIQEPEYYAWLRDVKNYTPESLLNHANEQDLRTEYQTYQQFQANIEIPPKNS